MARRSASSRDQEEIFSFLADPATFAGGAAVQRVDTHGAAVFLGGGEAYKVKRAVRFPFMDFSTLEKRRAACEQEIVVNRDNAPGLYLGVVPIMRRPDGLALGGAGEPVEWAVHMRRFDERATLDRLADRGELTREIADRLAEIVLAAHRRAPLRDGEAATRALESYLDQNEAAFASDPALFDPVQARRLAAASRAALAAVRGLLVARGAAGHVRRCHGDLHLRNIALIDGAPVLFDAVEFDDSIATGDVLYDLAFLLMDLEERGLRGLANAILNRYLAAGDDAQLEGLLALPIFLSLRSAIRAKVVAAGLVHLTGAASRRGADEARRYFRFAEAFLEPAPARLLAVGGLSGTGKSRLAAELAPGLGRTPGAVLLRSDVARKRRFGVAETDRLPAAAYGAATSGKIYEDLRRKAALALRAGQSVVLDAVHERQADRAAAEGVAREVGASFCGLWLDAPLSVRLARVGARRGDASDADAAVVRAQDASPIEADGWTRIDASGDLAAVRKIAEAALTVDARGPG